jgi:Ca2+-binding EF-hand superfamily protein
MTNRDDIANKTRNDLIHNPQNNFYYSNLFKKQFKELTTPFDNDPLSKIKRILCSSKYNLNKFFETVAKECGEGNYIVNKYQFRNIIKTLDIGLSNLEIDQIMFKSGKVTYDGNLNLKEFVNYLYSINQTLEEGKNNYSPIISEIKSLIYKYYSSPIICFQNNDTSHSGKIDFEKFKNIIFDMYKRNEQKLPNFTLIKNAFDIIDLRKDGLIDLNEWCKALGSYNGKLDVGEEKVPNGFDFYDNNTYLRLKPLKRSFNINNRRILREWETSNDVSEIYKYINKNKKMIQQKIKDSNYTIGTGNTRLINSNNLVLILKGIIPNNNLSLTQWKMIVNVAKKESLNGLIDLNEFFRLMEVTTKKLTSHPSIINKKRLTKSQSDLSLYHINDAAYKTIKEVLIMIIKIIIKILICQNLVILLIKIKFLVKINYSIEHEECKLLYKIIDMIFIFNIFNYFLF